MEDVRDTIKHKIYAGKKLMREDIEPIIAPKIPLCEQKEYDEALAFRMAQAGINEELLGKADETEVETSIYKICTKDYKYTSTGTDMHVIDGNLYIYFHKQIIAVYKEWNSCYIDNL